MRAAYLGVMWILGITAWQVIVGWNRTQRWRHCALWNVMFGILTMFVQLPLLLFFSALSAASAVAREKIGEHSSCC